MYLRHIILFSLFTFFSPFLGKAQIQVKNNPWKQFIDLEKKEAKSDNESSNYKLIEKPLTLTYLDLKSMGIRVVRKLDQRYSITRIEGKMNPALNSWPANNQWKLNPTIQNLNPNSIYTLFVQTAAIEKTKTFLSINNVNFSQITPSVLSIEVPANFIYEKLLLLKEVRYIGQESQSPTVDSRVIDMNLNVNTVNVIHHDFPSLSGSDITLSIQEQQFRPDDIDLVGRSLPSSLSAEVESNHATNMATIAAGAGNSFINGKGVASGATLTSSDFTEVLPDADTDYDNLSVTVQNHSYGTSIENFYGIQAEAFDKSANNNPTLLHVISSGNQGLEKDTTGTYAGVEGFANLTGNFKMAKNIITVGSVDTVGRVIPFTSKGPAYDGRVKPEVVTYSTAGSSNSAALVSGISVLMQQAYLDQHDQLPDASLIKALLINSAKDRHTKAVDFLTGFGDVDAHRTLQNLTNDNYFMGTISHEEELQFNLAVPINALNLKVTISWNDPAAAANSNLALVNDLDMQLSHAATNWRPWVLNTTANADALSMAATRGGDHTNNVEQITIDVPENGDYTITVRGEDVADGPQKFFIAYQWDLAEQFNWSYPTANDNMPYDGETGSYFRWKSTLSNSTGSLAYSTDEGDNWETLASDIDLSLGYFRWLPPDTNTMAIARMSVNGTDYFTDDFSISRPQRMDVAFNCKDSVLLQWPRVADATYDIYTMGSKYLQKIETTTDTSLVITKNDFPTRYFTIQPQFLDGKLIPSYTIDYDLQGVSCYLTSFFPEVTSDDELFLNLQLGTTYGVEEVILERKTVSGFEQMALISPQSKYIRIQENMPTQGPNKHRAIIRFLNNEEIITEESLIYFLTETPFMVFPNPMRIGDELSIFSRTFQPNTKVLFELMSTSGQVMIQQQLQSNREFIPTTGLRPGLYIYHISTQGVTSSGKLMVVE